MQDDSIVFVGLDVHKDSITIACIGSSPSAPVIVDPPLAASRISAALVVTRSHAAFLFPHIV
jgi:hypothetical protein